MTICSIENSSRWKHDFKDGKGLRKGAYGPYFFRLKVPKFNSIGIHVLVSQKRLEHVIAKGVFGSITVIYTIYLIWYM